MASASVSQPRLDLVDRRAGVAPARRRRLFIRSMAQNRLTAVGRVAASSSQFLKNSVASCRVPARRALADAERQAHGRRHADGRRAANHHGLDGLGHLVGGPATTRRFPWWAACAGRPSRRHRPATQSSEAYREMIAARVYRVRMDEQNSSIFPRIFAATAETGIAQPCDKLRDVDEYRFSARIIPTRAGGEFTWPPTREELDAIEVIATRRIPARHDLPSDHR